MFRLFKDAGALLGALLLSTKYCNPDFLARLMDVPSDQMSPEDLDRREKILNHLSPSGPTLNCLIPMVIDNGVFAEEPADEEILQVVAKAVARPFGIKSMVVRLREAVLSQAKAQALSAQLDSIEYECLSCSHRFRSGEVVIFSGSPHSSACILCVKCGSPGSIRCYSCESSAAISIEAYQQLLLPHTCSDCQSGSSVPPVEHSVPRTAIPTDSTNRYHTTMRYTSASNPTPATSPSRQAASPRNLVLDSFELGELPELDWRTSENDSQRTV